MKKIEMNPFLYTYLLGLTSIIMTVLVIFLSK